jgi:CRISPR-associated protein Cmr5
MPGTREQARACDAHLKVTAVLNESWRRDYGRQCLRLPALIHQCGLCQALTFLEAKGAEQRNPYFHRLLDDLASVMGTAGGRTTLCASARGATLLEYERLTLEAIKCAQWFKRYAEAILKVRPGEGEEGAEK